MKRIIITLITGVIIMQLIQSLAPAVSTPDRARTDETTSRTELSPQFRDGKFGNTGNSLHMSPSNPASAAWKFFFTDNDRTPETELPRKPVNPEHFNSPDDNQLNVTWLGHSSLMINIDGYRIMTDPVFEKCVSIFGPTRFNGDVPLDIEQISRVDVVIISHNHYDHLNKYSVQLLNEKTERFVVPLAVGERLVKWGVARDKIVEPDWWEEFRFGEKLMVAATPAQHFSGRGLFDRNETLWASWVIRTPSHNVFFSGDSGYFGGFKKIGDKYGPFDMTFIECGAYNESWAQVHMFPEETVQAHLDLKGTVLHPIHWGTFNLSLHPWYEPMERLTAAADARNVITATPIVGDTTVYGQNRPSAKWWRQAMKETAADGLVVSHLPEDSEG